MGFKSFDCVKALKWISSWKKINKMFPTICLCCSSGCDDCSGTSNYCISCPTGKYLDNSTHTCVEDCNGKFLMQGAKNIRLAGSDEPFKGRVEVRGSILHCHIHSYNKAKIKIKFVSRCARAFNFLSKITAFTIFIWTFSKIIFKLPILDKTFVKNWKYSLEFVFLFE